MVVAIIDPKQMYGFMCQRSCGAGRVILDETILFAANGAGIGVVHVRRRILLVLPDEEHIEIGCCIGKFDLSSGIVQETDESKE